MIRVAILGDIRLNREALAALVATDPRLEPVTIANPAALEGGGAGPVHVVVVDGLGEDRGAAIMRELRGIAAPVVVLGAPREDEDVIALAELGVVGFVERDGTLGELVGRMVVLCGYRAAAGRRRGARDRRAVGDHWRAMTDVEERKRYAAEVSAELVEPGMRVGLGTGSTVAHLLPALARRAVPRVRYVATSVQTAAHARALGLAVEEFEGAQALDRLDLAIDGADQVDTRWWVVKGGGGAHTREKIVAAAAERFVVIVTAEKLVEAVGPPVPLELLPFGLAATLCELPGARLRPGAAPTPDRGVLADYGSAFGDPALLSARLAATPGVVDHGLFPPSMISDVIVGGGDPQPFGRISASG